MKNSPNGKHKVERNAKVKRTSKHSTKDKFQKRLKTSSCSALTDGTTKSTTTTTEINPSENQITDQNLIPTYVDDEDCFYTSGNTTEMRDCFLKLLQLVPLDENVELGDDIAVSRMMKSPFCCGSVCSGRKISKLQLLQGAIDYILDLESTLETRMNGCTSHPIGQFVFPLSNQEEGLALNADLQRQIYCLPPS